MTSRRLALLVLLCTVVAVQTQSQFSGRRFSSRRTSSSSSGQTSPRGRSSFSRTSTSSLAGRSAFSQASNSRSSSQRRLGSGAVQTTSQLSSRAGGFSSSGRTASGRSSSSKSTFSSRRKPARPASKPTFGRTRSSSSSSSPFTTTGSSRTPSSKFNRQRPSATKSSSKPTFGSSRRKTSFSKRPSSSRSSSPSGSSSFGRGSTSNFGRGSSSNLSRSKSRPQSSGSPFRSGAQKKKLKQAPTVNFNCPEPDGFFADSSQCDKYFECKEGVAKRRTCPDGLLFHPERTYPCVYPVETDCQGRSAQQDPQPTEGCPRQFATFKAAGDVSCGAYTRCINGIVYPSNCVEGLAFDARTLGCEYADLVEGCDATAYLGFECPRREFTPDQVGEFTREQHPTDCTKFYVCMNKEDGSVAPRLQGCPEPAVFDPAKGACNTQPQEVPGCENAIPTAVLAAYQQRENDEQERRETRLAQLRAKLQG